MKSLVFVLALSICSTGVWADRYSDCSEGQNIARQIHGCTQIVELEEQEPQKNRASAYVYRALAYFFGRDFDRAIADLDKAIALYPNDPKTYNNRAAIYHEKGKHESAVADLTKAIEINPNAVYFANRGRLYSEMGQVDRATADYAAAMALKQNDAIALDPNDAAVNPSQGVASKD
jgi:tetratricopeptide (TPR) repeat protein